MKEQGKKKQETTKTTLNKLLRLLFGEVFSKLAEISIGDRILLLTHTDLDGSGPAVLLRVFFPDLVVRHCSNACMDKEIENTLTDPETGEKYDAVIICDISCKLETAERIDGNMTVKKVVLLDHHVTAMDLNRFDWAVVRPEVVESSDFERRGLKHSSGTSLLYNYLEFVGLIETLPDRCWKTAEEFAFLVAGYDTWDWVKVFGEDNRFHEMQTIFEQYGMAMFEKVYVDKLKYGFLLVSDNEDLLLQIAESKKQSFINSLRISSGSVDMPDGRPYTFDYVQTDRYFGDVYAKLKEVNPEAAFYILDYGKGVSLRTDKEGINLGALVKPLGGGGHPGAAGIRISSDLRLRILREVFQTPTFKLN